MGWTRRSAGWAPTALTAVLALTACGEPALLDPTRGDPAERREQVIARIDEGLAVLADHFDAGAALGRRVDTRCSAGTDNWKIHDTYRATCSVDVTTAFLLDHDPTDALATLEAHLAELGWGDVEWMLTGEYYADGWAGFLQSGRPLTDLEGVRAWNDGVPVGVGFLWPGTPIPEPQRHLEEFEHSPVGIYYGSTEGEDWQEAWTGWDDGTTAVLRGGGFSDFAQQPW